MPRLLRGLWARVVSVMAASGRFKWIDWLFLWLICRAKVLIS